MSIKIVMNQLAKNAVNQANQTQFDQKGGLKSGGRHAEVGWGIALYSTTLQTTVQLVLYVVLGIQIRLFSSFFVASSNNPKSKGVPMLLPLAGLELRSPTGLLTTLELHSNQRKEYIGDASSSSWHEFFTTLLAAPFAQICRTIMVTCPLAAVKI